MFSPSLIAGKNLGTVTNAGATLNTLREEAHILEQLDSLTTTCVRVYPADRPPQLLFLVRLVNEPNEAKRLAITKSPVQSTRAIPRAEPDSTALQPSATRF